MMAGSVTVTLPENAEKFLSWVACYKIIYSKYSLREARNRAREGCNKGRGVDDEEKGHNDAFGP